MVESNIFEYLPRDILELSAKENSSDFEDINHEDELIDYYYQEEECENVNENYNDQNYVKVIIANSNESNNEEKNKKKVPIFKIEKVKRNKKRRRKPRTIPDIEGCFTQGETMDEAVTMAQDAIGLMLEDQKVCPKPSLPSALTVDPGDFVAMVPFDMDEYKKKFKPVKKTLSIPGWLNDAAEAAHINFSGVLQEGLKSELGLI